MTAKAAHRCRRSPVGRKARASGEVRDRVILPLQVASERAVQVGRGLGVFAALLAFAAGVSPRIPGILAPLAFSASFLLQALLYVYDSFLPLPLLSASSPLLPLRLGLPQPLQLLGPLLLLLKLLPQRLLMPLPQLF